MRYGSSARSTRYAGPSLRVGVVWLLLALLAQGTVMHFAVVNGAEPSIVLVAVVWFAMRAEAGRAAVFGFLAGLGEDVIAFDAAGTWTIATTFTALLASLPARRFFEDSIPLFALVTACATLVRSLVYWSMKSLEGYPAGYATIHFHKALDAAVLNALLGTFVALIARHLERRRAPMQIRE